MLKDYRNVLLLACCQALLLANASGLASLSVLVGYELAANKAFATLGVTTYVLGSAAASLPMALWMARIGRRRGFMTGALVNVAGCALGAVALWQSSFPLFCLATGIIGVYNATGLQYRYAAAEVAAPLDKARAISFVLAGGVLGGVIGPEVTKWSRLLFATPFLGTFVALAALAVLALALQSCIEVPPPRSEAIHGDARPLVRILAQPVFIVAALCAAVSYGLMNLLMTATPIAMTFCGHPFAATTTVIEWHVVAMFAPGFVTGSLIARVGVMKVIAAGIAVMCLAVAVALHGLSTAHFVASLALVGIGWNFMYTGATTLLMASHTPAEKARVQGVNDLILFVAMALSSLGSGALVTKGGWATANWVALAVLTLVALALVLIHGQRSPMRSAATA